MITRPGFDGPIVTLSRACELLKCERTRAFTLLAEGKLTRGPKLGRRTTVTLESVEQLVKPETRKPRRRGRRGVGEQDFEAVRPDRPGGPARPGA